MRRSDGAEDLGALLTACWTPCPKVDMENGVAAAATAAFVMKDRLESLCFTGISPLVGCNQYLRLVLKKLSLTYYSQRLTIPVSLFSGFVVQRDRIAGARGDRSFDKRPDALVPGRRGP